MRVLYPVILLKGGHSLSGTITHSDVTSRDDYSFEAMLIALAIESHGTGVQDRLRYQKGIGNLYLLSN